MITDNDIKKLKQTFVTKNDLKKELNRFATKEDLEQLAINTGAGFLDVQRQFAEVRTDISELKSDVVELKDDFKDMKLQMYGMEKNIISAIQEIKEDHEVTKKRVIKLERLAFSN